MQNPLSDGKQHKDSRNVRRLRAEKRKAAFDKQGKLATAMFLSLENSLNCEFLLLLLSLTTHLTASYVCVCLLPTSPTHPLTLFSHSNTAAKSAAPDAHGSICTAVLDNGKGDKVMDLIDPKEQMQIRFYHTRGVHQKKESWIVAGTITSLKRDEGTAYGQYNRWVSGDADVEPSTLLPIDTSFTIKTVEFTVVDHF